jgi:hypothetical protein
VQAISNTVMALITVVQVTSSSKRHFVISWVILECETE